MEITVEQALSSINETLFGYIKIIIVSDSGEAVEKGFETFTNKQMFDIFQKKCLAYYSIGSYFYIVVKN